MNDILPDTKYRSTLATFYLFTENLAYRCQATASKHSSEGRTTSKRKEGSGKSLHAFTVALKKRGFNLEGSSTDTLLHFEVTVAFIYRLWGDEGLIGIRQVVTHGSKVATVPHLM